jgi:hypothetical protein
MLFVLAIAMVVGCGSGSSDTNQRNSPSRIGVSNTAQSTKSEPSKKTTTTSTYTREATVPGKALDDYARALEPIEDKLDKLYERMNHDFDKVFAGMAAALNSSSQAEKAQAMAKAQIFSDEMYNEWDTLLRRFVQLTPPGELIEFHELFQEGFQLNHRAFFDFSSQITILAATGQMNEERVTSVSNDMLEADRKFTRAAAEWAKVQARYK